MRTFETIQNELRAGATTCERLTGEYLGTIEARRSLNAFLSVFPEKAIAQAQTVDRKLANGTAGKLAGMVLSIKDVICVKDERVT